MSRSIYVTSAEGNSGKSTVALGLVDSLSHRVKRVGVFRPVARSSDERDYVLDVLLAHDGVDLEYDDCVGVGYDAVHADPEAALAVIVERYHAVAQRSDAVVIVGSDYTDVSTPTELSFNARIAANLGAPVLLVLGGRESGATGGRGLDESGPRTADDMRRVAEVAVAELEHEHAQLLGIIANRADPASLDAITAAVQTVAPEALVAGIPEDPYLIAPTVEAVVQAAGGTVLRGDPALLQREVLGAVVAAMSMENVLPRLTEGAVVLIPGDRSEVLLPVEPERLFTHLDDHRRLSSHMEKPSLMTAGASMRIDTDAGHGQSVGSVIRMSGRVLGVRLGLEEVVTEHAPPQRKVWETVGEPTLLVIGAYRMGFSIEPFTGGSRLVVFIDYARPGRGLARLLGGLVGRYYAAWCTRRMAEDARAAFPGPIRGPAPSAR